MKLGRWDEYLATRSGLLALNNAHRELLSNDLGAVAGLMFDIGSGRYAPPPSANDEAARQAWAEDLAQVRESAAAQRKDVERAAADDRSHTDIQGLLRDLGKELGYEVWVASNDRRRPYLGGQLADGCVDCLPAVVENAPGADAVRLIDVLWLDKDRSRVMAAFEVEHTTSIYSGIVRMLDLALGCALQASEGLFLVAPDSREEGVRAQIARPAFSRVADLKVRFLSYGELEKNRVALGRFGSGIKGVHAISKVLGG